MNNHRHSLVKLLSNHLNNFERHKRLRIKDSEKTERRDSQRRLRIKDSFVEKSNHLGVSFIKTGNYFILSEGAVKRCSFKIPIPKFLKYKHR